MKNAIPPSLSNVPGLNAIILHNWKAPNEGLLRNFAGFGECGVDFGAQFGHQRQTEPEEHEFHFHRSIEAAESLPCSMPNAGLHCLANLLRNQADSTQPRVTFRELQNGLHGQKLKNWIVSRKW